MNSENLSQLVLATAQDQEMFSRITKKMNQAVKLIYAIVTIQALGILYSLWNVLNFNDKFHKEFLSAGLEPLSLSSAISVFPAAIIILSFLTIREIQSKTTWGWVGACLVFLFSVPTLALPLAVFGMLIVLDEVVRKKYLKDLGMLGE